MNYIIRAADSGDIAAFTEIYRESVLNGVASYEIDPPSFEEMRTRYASITEQGYPYIVAVEQTGLILGYAYASAFRTRPAYRWLVEDSIYLAPDARGKGVGKALLADLIRRSTDLGFRQMVAVIGGAHPASIAVHRSAGFEHGGLMKATGFKHGRWLDTVIMQKSLGEGAESDPTLDAHPATNRAAD
ncbi:GNAT family N-acetyltransferase [Sinorhizobium sp. BG8]|uniref:GNAT family N-acetyltransferase n=1 Tax=Sinorhizobium sp. BG8 TaxID=2613773 RepID=UPI00193E6112|nr:GNAT family N-acetyltransferase [Sinorhizobium sp. BG8]QRM53543.1 N-acetyltransferase family protein [Sinorhizobium sp. BG8]